MGERWLQGQDGPQGSHCNPRAQVRILSVLDIYYGLLTFTMAETTRSSEIGSRMRIGRSCLPTILTAAVHHILPVKSTRRKICSRRQKRGSRMRLSGAFRSSAVKCLLLISPLVFSVTSRSYAYCTIFT